jgi:TonB family protein
LIGIVASLAIHAVLVVFVPPPEPEALPVKEPRHIVELRSIEVPLPDLPPLKPQLPRPTELEPPPLLPLPEEVPEQPAGLHLDDLAVATRLPEIEAPLPAPSTIVIPDTPENTPVIPPERTGRGLEGPKGIPEGTQLGGKLTVPHSFSDFRETPPGSMKTLQGRLIRRELGKKQKAAPATGDIYGPVAARVLVFRPPPPSVEEGAEGEIEVKFWVLADGTVGRIVLLRRGDLTLETAVLRNLKQWKFNSQPPRANVPEQWGTLTFRFLSGAAKRTESLPISPPSLKKQ